MRGHVDIINHFDVFGWILATSNEDKDRAVISVDGVEAGQAIGNLFRSDLCEAGIGDGWCAFRYSFVNAVGIFKPVRIEVRSAKYGYLLGNGDKLLPGLLAGDGVYRAHLSGPCFAVAPADVKIDSHTLHISGRCILPNGAEIEIERGAASFGSVTNFRFVAIENGKDLLRDSSFYDFAFSYNLDTKDRKIVDFVICDKRSKPECINHLSAEIACRFAAPVSMDWLSLPDEQNFVRTGGKGTTAVSFAVGGVTTALKISRIVNSVLAKNDPLTILDWGIGCGRVAVPIKRHFFPTAQVIGVDVDSFNIAWCQKYITDIETSICDFYPKINVLDQTIDVVYGISVMTHLTEDVQEIWLRELKRILKPGGISILTIHGDYSLVAQRRQTPTVFRQLSMFGISDISYDWNLGPLLARKSYYCATYQLIQQVEEEWSKHFTVLRHFPAGNALLQDFVVLRRS
jgi:ubiquinone/menaquinone biosynthesis C-methylase UbiE